MKKLLLALISFSFLSTQASSNSFGPHDPLKTKGAFAEIMRNNTGTQTEQFYRTSGLFEQLAICAQQCKKHPDIVEKLSHHSDYIFDHWLKKDSQKKANILASKQDSPEYQKAFDILQAEFTRCVQNYKGDRSYTIHPTLLIDDEGGTFGSSYTVINKASISVGLHTHITRIAKTIDSLEKIKFLKPKDSTSKSLHLCERLLNWILKIEIAQARATFYHELSHPHTSRISQAMRLENPSALAPNEEYTNVIASLNSPTPLDTAFDELISGGYHHSKLEDLIKNLQNEGVAWQSTNKRRLFAVGSFLNSAEDTYRKAKTYITQTGTYDPTKHAARFMTEDHGLLP